MRVAVAAAALVAVVLAFTPKVLSPQSSESSSASASMQRKLQHIETNGAQATPDSAPTVLTEQEVNAYFAAGNIKLPAGVQSVSFQGQPQVIIATTRVDFDQVKAGRNSYNPLLSVFSGVHDVAVSAHAYGKGGRGFVHVDSVSLDNVEIPRFALKLFVEKYIEPKYPDIGLDSQFALPDRVDTATVGLHKLTVTQK